jgi:uncharacterized membrane protein YoaK (UPF0700 family)
MADRCAKPEDWLPYELAFVGGYCDAGSFVLTKTFTGHVTGNLVLAAIAIAAHDWRSLLAHSSAIGAFLFATVLSMLVMRRLQSWPSKRMLASAMFIEAILIADASLITTSNTLPRLELFLVLMSFGLGLQNGALTRVGGIGVHTTYITGVITSLLSAETKAAVAETLTSATTKPDPDLGLLGRIWITFVLGAGSGAAMVSHFKSLGLLGASVLLGLFSLIEVQQ